MKGSKGTDDSGPEVGRVETFDLEGGVGPEFGVIHGTGGEMALDGFEVGEDGMEGKGVGGGGGEGLELGCHGEDVLLVWLLLVVEIEMARKRRERGVPE